MGDSSGHTHASRRMLSHQRWRSVGESVCLMSLASRLSRCARSHLTPSESRRRYLVGVEFLLLPPPCRGSIALGVSGYLPNCVTD